MSKLIDLTGQNFGKWTVLHKAETKRKGTYWTCQCECGTIKDVCTTSLRKGTSQSCGCEKIKKSRENNGTYIDEKGNHYGKLLVVDKDEILSVEKHRAMWICKCDCGNYKTVSSKMLRNGHTISCGCLRTSGGEYFIKKILNENNIDYLFDKEYFKDLILPSGALGRYDFILLKNNLPFRLIEFDGIQHYKETAFNGTIIDLEYRKKCDKIKNDYALKNNIPLIRIPYWEKDNLTLELIMSDKYLINEKENNIA